MSQEIELTNQQKLNTHIISPLQEKLIEVCWESGAYQISSRIDQYSYTSNTKGPDYFRPREDSVKEGSWPQLKTLMAECIAEINQGFSFEGVLGVPSTATPIAEAVAEILGIQFLKFDRKIGEFPSLYWRISPRIEPELYPGNTKNILLLDNAITSGISAWLYTQIAQSRGFRSSMITNVLNRQEGGVKNLAGLDLRNNFVLTIEDLLSRAPAFVTKEQKKLIRDYHQTQANTTITLTSTLAQQLIYTKRGQIIPSPH